MKVQWYTDRIISDDSNEQAEMSARIVIIISRIKDERGVWYTDYKSEMNY